MSIRILWLSNGPHCGTGYGTQTAQMLPRLRDAGHQVAVFANYGLGGSKTEWNGFRMYPSGLEANGSDLIHGHADHWNADVVIVLYDAFALPGMILRRLRQQVCFWQPVDCEPLGRGDLDAFQASGAQPIAMSRFGERMLAEAGLDPMYAPHGIDLGIFRPPEEILEWKFRGTRYREAARRDLRAEMSIPADAFVIGMNVHNKDADRKAVFEQMSAFALFRRRHSDALLLAHTMPHPAMSGNNLIGMAEYLGISDAVRWADPYSLLAGEYTQQDMAEWYGRLNLFSGASRGEGFGLPLMEAQACGVPVVATDASAMPEVAGPGWLVGGQPYWVKGQRTSWITPDIGELAACYEEAYDGEAERRSDASLKFSRAYEADYVFRMYWVPILEKLEAGLADGSAVPVSGEGWRVVR